MKRDKVKELWEEVCFLLSDNIKPDISEKDYEHQVVRAIEKLGWLEYKGEIERQPSIQHGRNTIRPDIVIYGADEKALVAIEIKRPSENSSNERTIGQLRSYMLQVKAKFGLVIGDCIKLFYDGPEKEDIIADPLLLEEIPFKPASKKGVAFVENFQKDCLLNQSYGSYIDKLINKVKAKRNINDLKEVLKSQSTVNKIKAFLREEFRVFGPDIVEQALASIRIELAIDENTKPIDSQVVEPVVLVQKGTILETVFELIARHKDGISKTDLTSVTGIKGRTLSNALYKLSRRGKIQSLERGVYRKVVRSRPTAPIKPRLKVKDEKPTGILTGNLLAVYKAVKKKKRGNTIDQIEYWSGLEGRQVSNALYKLSKKGLIERVQKGHYIVTQYVQSANIELKPQKSKRGKSGERPQGILETVYKLICRYKRGLDVQSIREKTGFETRQV